MAVINCSGKLILRFPSINMRMNLASDDYVNGKSYDSRTTTTKRRERSKKKSRTKRRRKRKRRKRKRRRNK